MASAAKFEFSNLTKIIPDAYHGTDAANVTSIQKTGLRVGTGGSLHLGDGIYFYESSIGHAKGYPKFVSKECKVAVFRCEIDLGRCIDLNNDQHKHALQKFAAQIRYYALDSHAFRKNHNITSLEDVTEPFILNLAAMVSGADTVRGTLGLGQNPLYTGSRLSGGARLVIAVRDPKKILATNLEYVET